MPTATNRINPPITVPTTSPTSAPGAKPLECIVCTGLDNDVVGDISGTPYGEGYDGVSSVVLAVLHHTMAQSPVVELHRTMAQSPVLLADFHHMAQNTMALSVDIPKRTLELDGASGARTSYRQRTCLHVCVRVSLKLLHCVWLGLF